MLCLSCGHVLRSLVLYVNIDMEDMDILIDLISNCLIRNPELSEIVELCPGKCHTCKNPIEGKKGNQTICEVLAFVRILILTNDILTLMILMIDDLILSQTGKV